VDRAERLRTQIVWIEPRFSAGGHKRTPSWTHIGISCVSDNSARRILFLSPTACLGGAERVLLACLEGARAAPDFRPHLLTLCPRPFLDLAVARGIDAESLPLPPALEELGDGAFSGRSWWRPLRRLCSSVPALAGFLRSLRARIRALAPDLIHSNGIKTH